MRWTTLLLPLIATAAALPNQGRKRPHGTCAPKDDVFNRLKKERDAVPFCCDLLDIPTEMTTSTQTVEGRPATIRTTETMRDGYRGTTTSTRTEKSTSTIVKGPVTTTVTRYPTKT
jgi:hypothetical protein